MRKIVTQHVYPPIPRRNFDWRAWYEGEDEETRTEGWGATEEEAIADLKMIHADEDADHVCVGQTPF